MPSKKRKRVQLKKASRPKQSKPKTGAIKPKGKAHKVPAPRPRRKATFTDEVADAEGLTPRQHRFIQLFPRYLNGARTARESGYSQKSAHHAAYVNMRNVHIREKIDEQLKQQAMGRSEIIARLSDIASGTMEDCISFDKKDRAYIDLRKVKAAGKMHLVRKYKIGVQGIAVELYSALEAQDKLARVHGLYKEVGDPDRPMNIKVEDLEAIRKKRWAQTRSALKKALAGGAHSGEAHE